MGRIPFVVDTGANRSVISRELAGMLKLPAGVPLELHDTGGVQTVDTAVIDDLAYGSRVLHGVQAPVLAQANLGADGMLGLDMLRNQHVVMDFGRHRFLAGESTADIEALEPFSIVVQGHSRLGQLVLVDAETRGEPIFVIVDSGAQNTVGNRALQKLMAEGPPPARPPPRGDVISVTGRSTSASLEKMPELRLGGITLTRVPIAYADLHTFRQFRLEDRPAMLLGMDVLRLFRSVAVDFRQREVLFMTK